MNRPALLLLVPLLPLTAGCDVHSKNRADADDNISVHADQSGNIAFRSGWNTAPCSICPAARRRS